MDKENRPKIPAELERRILVEAGHRCSIPTCRQIKCEVHHIIPWAKVKEHTYDNLICLCRNCHGMAEDGTIDRKSLRMYKYNLRLLHDKYTQFEVDLLFDLYKLPETSHIDLPEFMYYMFRRSIESKLIEIAYKEKHYLSSSIGYSFFFIMLTNEGREFVFNLSKE
ncbi:MAG TPA: HNH endonuclease [Flavobacterium sp.]|nr:HNH endonuclease [Flavobacterium sp.]